MGIRQLLRENPLKLAGFGGGVILLALAGILVFSSLVRDHDIFPQRMENTFSRDLKAYDDALKVERPEQLAQRLDRLEKRARAQEQWLSILKRRRNMAKTNAIFLAPYQKSAQEALKAFPYSEPIVAVAGDSLLYDPLTVENADLLRKYANQLSTQRFIPLALSLHVLAGDMKTPDHAASIPGIDKLLGADIPQELTEQLLIDEILLEILRGELSAIGVKITEGLRVYPLSGNLLRVGAEFFYDHDSPLRSVELFYRLGDSFMGRAADALALAGEVPGARNIWAALSSSPADNTPEVQGRYLYNLAITSSNSRETVSWLEQIFASPREIRESLGIYGIILYSRFQNSSRAVTYLQESGDNPLLDLEILRRQMETMPLNRAVAEVWLLLGRRPEAEELYRWGAWYFDRQKLYVETAQLLRIISQRRIEGPWVELCRSLALLRQGRIDEGEKILEEEYRKNPSGDWRYAANIARVQEGRKSYSEALANYEFAAGLSDRPQDVSRLQFRISRCLGGLGRQEESRRALAYAVELDPDNFEASSLLRRR
jgi:tetratricopeptide (TPR) repeat protein